MARWTPVATVVLAVLSACFSRPGAPTRGGDAAVDDAVTVDAASRIDAGPSDATGAIDAQVDGGGPVLNNDGGPLP